ncbi:MAG: GNAT family N-acetyltransferase [Candidatus Fermentibacteraceae bacterium]
MRRTDREITDPFELIGALCRFKSCTLGISADGRMRLVPMCFGYSENCLYFHSATEGEKIEMLKRNPAVVFEMSRILAVVGTDDIHYESVIGEGEVEFLQTVAEKRVGMAVLLKSFSGSRQEVSDSSLEGTCVFRVRIAGMTMKRNPAVWEKPVLDTPRLVLRGFSKGDEAELRAAADHESIARGTAGLPHPYTLEDAVSFVSGRYNDFLGETGGVFAVVEKESGLIVGCAGISPTRKGAAEIGYWIIPSRWNRGYCTEAVKRLIAFGMEVMGLHRISANHFPDNPASGRVLEKAGMTREGVLKGYLTRDGEHLDAVVWAVTV